MNKNTFYINTDEDFAKIWKNLPKEDRKDVSLILQVARNMQSGMGAYEDRVASIKTYNCSSYDGLDRDMMPSSAETHSRGQNVFIISFRDSLVHADQSKVDPKYIELFSKIESIMDKIAIKPFVVRPVINTFEKSKPQEIYLVNTFLDFEKVWKKVPQQDKDKISLILEVFTFFDGAQDSYDTLHTSIKTYNCETYHGMERSMSQPLAKIHSNGIYIFKISVDDADVYRDNSKIHLKYIKLFDKILNQITTS